MMSKKDIITIINRSDSIIRGIIDDLLSFNYARDTETERKVFELVKKYKDMLTVTTPKQRREKK